jgi:beta-lactam-binding protein with PASTA domain
VTGKQYEDISALSYIGYSLLLGDSGQSIGDVIVCDQVTQNTNYALVLNGDGTGYVNANGDLTRQAFTCDFFQVSSQGLLGSFLVYINDAPPEILNPLPTQFNYPLGAPVSLDFVNGTPQYVYDPNGDPLTMALASGTLPPGISISATALVGTASTAGTYSFTLSFTDPVGESIQVPVTFYVYGIITMSDLTGLTQAQAVTQIIALGLLFGGTKNGINSNTIGVGLVASQSVLAGQTVAFGTYITISLSLGPSGIVTPYTSYDAAVSAIVNAGLIVSQPIIWVNDPVVPRDYVVAQSPPGNTLVLPNAIILLTVSLGPANTNAQVTVGNYVGMVYTDAQRSMALNNIGTTNVVFQNSSTVADTVVISQSIAAGTLVAPGTTVVLTVSMGNAPVFPSTPFITLPKVTYP